MARTPNYNFERKERDRQKAIKKAEKLAAKLEAREKRGDQPQPDASEADSSAD